MCISVVEMLVGLWNWCRRFRRNVSARNVDPHVFACAKMPVSTGEDDSSKRVDESSSPVDTCRRRRFQNNFLHTICVVDVDVAVEIHIECFCIRLILPVQYKITYKVLVHIIGDMTHRNVKDYHSLRNVWKIIFFIWRC